MNESFWRIAPDSKTYEAHDLSGLGAKVYGGRWNEVGVPMVYASSSRSLACLETVVHFNTGQLPFNRYLVEIVVPMDLYKAAEVVDAADLIGWDAEPAGIASVSYGSDWSTSRRSALLVVPSVIVPEEMNLLLNPEHPDLKRITARKVRKWLYDPRMVKV